MTITTTRKRTTFKTGDTLRLEGGAGILYRIRPITVRVLCEHDWTPEDSEYVWIDAYELDARGKAIERRSLYVLAAGAVKVEDPRKRTIR